MTPLREVESAPARPAHAGAPRQVQGREAMSGPTQLGALFADHMGRADACECGNTEPPRAAAPVDGGWMTSYLCTDCGQAWTRDWKDA